MNYIRIIYSRNKLLKYVKIVTPQTAVAGTSLDGNNKLQLDGTLSSDSQENPLTFTHKLQKYNFRSSDNLYYHFHALPPSLLENGKSLSEISKKMEFKFSREWQALFMASAFINIAEAV